MMMLQTLEGDAKLRSSFAYVDSVEGRLTLAGEDAHNYHYVFETEYLRGCVPGLHGNLNGFKIKMPKIKFKIKMPKFKMPKLKLPKFSMPKFKLKLPKFKMPDLGKFYDRAIGKPLATFGAKTGEAFAAAAQMPMDFVGQTMQALGSVFPGAGISQMGQEGMGDYADAGPAYDDSMMSMLPALMQPSAPPQEFFDPMEAGSPAEYMTREQQEPAKDAGISWVPIAGAGVALLVLLSLKGGGRRRR